MINLIIASTSSLWGEDYLEYFLPRLEIHFKDCKTILFIPYARPSGISHEEYTKKVHVAFSKINISVQGIHELENPVEAIEKAEGIFTGGGNTFILVYELCKKEIMTVLATTLKKRTPYLGTSAGGNICGLTMQTTNDMPIIYPPSFETLGLIPFDLNPHFLDAHLQSKYMGETRDTRISEFHKFNSIPVLGLREGSWLEANEDGIILKGTHTARLFIKNQTPQELLSETNLSQLYFL